jgi:uncharacterized protein YbgA (DUF1722 family)/uncharacterized protein YbbK (DUF523 family)
MEHGKPRVVFSRCLGFEHCRYNGGIIQEPAVEHLKPFVEIETVCPEVEIGLGIPRDPIRLVGEPADPRLVQPTTGLDVTSKMRAFADDRLGDIGAPDGFVLKFGSPSCGPREVKCYVNEKKGAASTKTHGMFGGTVIERFPGCAIEDEGRLKNFDIRQHFLTRLFTQARFRRLQGAPTMKGLVAFHSRHKLLFMAYNQTKMRALGRVVANSDKQPLDLLLATYAEGLRDALGKAPRRVSAINVLMHALGYVSDSLSSAEKAFFLDSLGQYRNGHVPLSVPTSLMRSWILRFDVSYLADQVYFEPYPQDLVEVLDSGKGRTF